MIPTFHNPTSAPPAMGASLLFSTSKGAVPVNVNHILRISASGSYSKLFFVDGKKLVVAKVLKWFEQQLPTDSFLRIHRGHLVNQQCIRYYCEQSGKMMLTNNEWVAVARRKKCPNSHIAWVLKAYVREGPYFNKAYNAKLANQCSPA